MKKIAAFTIVFNEKYFLPIWLKHYGETLGIEDVYVLDNNTTDESTNNLDVNCVIKVPSDQAHDAPWLLRTVKEFGRRLLKEYKYVIFAEVDELITLSSGGDLTEYILKSGKTNIRCTGYEVVHQIKKEAPLDLEKPILSQRSTWYKSRRFSKPLIFSQVPCWCVGFHNDNEDLPFDPDVLLIHLHKACLNLALKRNAERLGKKTLAKTCLTNRYGWQNRLKRNELIEFFNKMLQPLSGYENIPLWAKELL